MQNQNYVNVVSDNNNEQYYITELYRAVLDKDNQKIISCVTHLENNEKNTNGGNIIHVLARNKSAFCIHSLIEISADYESTSVDIFLKLTCEGEHQVQDLKGVINQQDNKGKSPLDIAIENNDIYLIEELEIKKEDKNTSEVKSTLCNVKTSSNNQIPNSKVFY